jgi:integrase
VQQQRRILQHNRSLFASTYAPVTAPRILLALGGRRCLPRYNKKKVDLISPAQFDEIVKKLWNPYDALIVLLYYTGIRISEALALKKEDFHLTSKTSISIDIHRLKGSKQTEALPIRRDAPNLNLLLFRVGQTAQKCPVFPMTARAVQYELQRFQLYPHYFRLNRITQLFAAGKTIAQVRAWTGLTLNALDHYLGIVSNEEIGKEIE